MPIKRLCSDPDDGKLIQVCAGCGAEHTISLNRAGQKSKTGPFALHDGDTLIVQIDAAPARTATFASGASTSVAAISAAQLADAFRAQLPGTRICEDAGGLLIESRTSGETSRVEILGG
ncbi:MAG TPA: hypothetical protein VFP84_10510, partial [Kofleriaceae bacterium]|nr:hypothetical protein [Kofleriaceae bacterium]